MSGVIVHEWMEKHGGAEKVVDEMAVAFPKADVRVLWNDAVGRYGTRTIHETWMAKTALRKNKAAALPFMPLTWRNLGSAEYEWILCSSHLFAHHAKFSGKAARAKKLVYVHTPARYLWTPEIDARGSKLSVQIASKLLRPIDKKRAQELDSVVANSEFVKDRIRACWDRDSSVIYPPVDVTQFATDRFSELSLDEQKVIAELPTEFVLGASRFIPYKRLDKVIELGSRNGVPVVLAGSGPEEKRLREQASDAAVPVVFVSAPSQALLREIYARAIAYVFPSLEDFGIMPVEAMAAGVPVIGLNRGGVSESVVHGVSGILVEDFEGEQVQKALSETTALSRHACTSRAWEFDSSKFRKNIQDWVGHLDYDRVSTS